MCKGVNINLLLNWSLKTEYLFIGVFLLYLITDLIWLIIKPHSVTNAKIIYLHHVITIIGVIIVPKLDYGMKYMICLEYYYMQMNTLFRLLRYITTGYTNVVLNILFSVSLEMTRCVIGPIVLVMIWKRLIINVNIINLTLLITSLVLNTLTVLWTNQLIGIIINKKWTLKN